MSSSINVADVEHHLWDDIERRSVGMLMRMGGHPRHAQPMTAFVERETRRLWFFARRNAEITQDLGAGETAMFIWQHGELLACIGGRLALRFERARIDQYWNAVVAAWRPGGRDDPNLTMLCLDCEDAEVWLSHDGPFRAAWEIAKANALHHEPDLGAHAHLTFH